MSQFGRDLDNFSACRTVRIIGSECVENYTVYIIEVTIGPYTWTVKHRYSDFHDLHDKLVSTFKIDKSLLPPKKLFGNQSETFIKKRQNDLEVYLQTILYYLAQKIPPILAYFLDFHKYEIHGITQALAEDLYNRGELILQAKEPFQMTTLHLYALTERLKLPEPTCGFTLLFPDSGDVKKDIGHILDFITRLKHLKICGSRDPVGSSNIDMNELRFDLTLFKSLQTLEILNCNSMLITGFETIKQTLQKIEAHHSMKEIKDLLLQEFSHWRDEDGTLIVAFWNHILEADFGHNNIKNIDESIQLLPRVEHLDLSHNQIDTIQNLQWLSQLTFLDLSHNNIHQLDSLHTKLGNLKTLNLAGNRIRHLQGLSKLFSLVNLDISNNEISEIIEVKHISGLPCMEKLSLIGNSVTIVLDYRTKVLAMFSERANEICLDNMKPSQKELDTVAVVLALQKSKENKEKLRKMMPNKHATDLDNVSRDSSPRNASLLAAPLNSTIASTITSCTPTITATNTNSSNSSSTPPVSCAPPRFGPGLTSSSTGAAATTTSNPSESEPIDSLPSILPPLPPPLPGLDSITTSTIEGHQTVESVSKKPTLLSLAVHHSSLLGSSSAFQTQRRLVVDESNNDDIETTEAKGNDDDDDDNNIDIKQYDPIEQTSSATKEIPCSDDLDTKTDQQTASVCQDSVGQWEEISDISLDEPRLTIQPDQHRDQDQPLPIETNCMQTLSSSGRPNEKQENLKINDQTLPSEFMTLSLSEQTSPPKSQLPSHLLHNADTKHYRPKDLHQKSTSFIYKYEHLPSTLNRNFCHNLISNLIGSTSSDSGECVEHLFWSYSLQYTQPHVISPACVVLTQKHIFIQHLKGLNPDFPGVPNTITYYILPLCNIQQIRVSQNFIQLEESFVGPSGIFLLYGLESSQVSKFSNTLLRCCKDLNTEHGEPEIIQANIQQQLSTLVEDAEQKEGFYSTDISFTALVISNGKVRTLALSENFLYLLQVNNFESPYPPPAQGGRPQEDDAILSARPIMASRNISFRWRENGKHCRLPEPIDTIRYELFPLSMEFGDKECLVVHFLSSATRDEYLEKFTTLRSQNCDRLSLVSRLEPEGANEDHNGETNKLVAVSTAISPLSNASTPINKDFLSINYNSLANSTTCSTPDTENCEKASSYLEIRRPSFTPPCDEQLIYLTKCNQTYKLVKVRSACLETLGKMNGRELVEYFYLNIAHIGYECEEMLYVVWADVVPYKNPDQVITSLVVLTSKAVYCISDSKVEIPPKIKRMWMTHCRHKSDSAIAMLQSDLQNEHHHCAGILHRGGCHHAKVPRAFITIPLSQLVQINIGMFDQCLRLTGPNEDSVCTIVTRECAATETFLQLISSALSSQVVTSADTPSDSEVDFYSLVTKTRSCTEGIEYIHPSKVRFCYPGEETISDIMYIISDVYKASLSSKTPYLIWVYILGFQIPVESADLLEAVTKASPRTVILTNQHLCLAAEDLVSYPLPEFARGLPDKPRHRILEVRKIEYLKRILVEQEPHKSLTLVFSDEDDEIEVDTSFEYYSPKEELKGRKSPPEVSVRLLFQSGKEEAKLLQMLKRQWAEIHLGEEDLPVHMMA